MAVSWWDLVLAILTALFAYDVLDGIWQRILTWILKAWDNK